MNLLYSKEGYITYFVTNLYHPSNLLKLPSVALWFFCIIASNCIFVFKSRAPLCFKNWYFHEILHVNYCHNDLRPLTTTENVCTPLFSIGKSVHQYKLNVDSFHWQTLWTGNAPPHFKESFLLKHGQNFCEWLNVPVLRIRYHVSICLYVTVCS